MLSPHGVLDIATYGDLRTALLKAAAGEPLAVVADLDDLDVQFRPALSLFSAVFEQLEQWPGIPLLLAAADVRQRDVLAGYRMDFYVSVYPSVTAAVASADNPPRRRIIRRKLPNSLASARLARCYVREICREWTIESRAGEAAMLVNELVENTLLHTYCAPSLRLELRRGLLTVAIYDDDPVVPTWGDPGSGQSSGGGLALVKAQSIAWGCSPTLNGGKVVWAVLAA